MNLAYSSYSEEGQEYVGQEYGLRTAPRADSTLIFLSPIFLSPIFLSPIFLSPIFLSPIFLSPIFLSPIFLSPIFLSLIFLSLIFLSRSSRVARRHTGQLQWCFLCKSHH